ncbi:MAG: hypothetical protein COB24_00840 [Hyphomicrobiales bacterium]|nr:MAG: hypothetical protein COB24_00840 [Hyphomicrobiales bacterium]
MTKAPKPKISYKRTHKGLRNISRLAQDIGRTSFKKQGFNGIEIFKQWPFIVGDHLSQYCAPEKISWPRGRSEVDSDQLNGATLVIKCLGAFALEIESQAPIILQRANIMFGYAALGKIKLKQSQTIDFETKYVAEPTPIASKEVTQSTQNIKNTGLRDALNALGAQIEHGQMKKK